MNKDERRYYSTEIEVRSDAESGEERIIGYAAKFDVLSENLGGFREKIDAGAFDDVLNDDVRAVFNHDSNFVLGRTKSGTLKLKIDDIGLRYEVTMPNTSAARDVMESIKRGDVDGSSFKFTVDKDNWKEDDDGRVIRTINKIGRLMDVGPVTFPAYPDASVAKRSLDDFLAKKDCQEIKSVIKLDIRKVSL